MRGANKGNVDVNGLRGMTYAAGGLTVDTAGYNVSMLNNTVSTSESGCAFVKQGDGKLTTDVLPPVDTLKVEQGALALTTGANVNNAIIVGRPELMHRWSFTDGSLADSVVGSTATEQGSGTKTYENNAITILRGSSAGSIVGIPECPQLPKGWKVVKSGNDLTLRKASGVMIMVN